MTNKKMKLKSKKYLNHYPKEDVQTEYSVQEAVALTQKGSYAKFRASLDLTINLGIDATKNEQRVNLTTTLPYSTGKVKRIIAIVNPDKKDSAQKAGALEAGGSDLIEKIKGGWLEFDVVVATPDLMPELAKVAKILGPKGLMPNPKTGTVTPDPAQAIKNLQQGQMNIRSGESNILHLVVGNDQQKPEEVTANIQHLLDLLNNNRPAKIKGQFIKSAFLSPTMGPSFRLTLT